MFPLDIAKQDKEMARRSETTRKMKSIGSHPIQHQAANNRQPTTSSQYSAVVVMLSNSTKSSVDFIEWSGSTRSHPLASMFSID